MNCRARRKSRSVFVRVDFLSLADAVDLQVQCKHAHWNVKGPNFIALQVLFDQVNEDVEDYIAPFAERAAQLGGAANSKGRVVTTRSHLSENGAHGITERDHVTTLASALASFGKLTRQAIEKSNELSDFVNADICTEMHDTSIASGTGK